MGYLEELTTILDKLKPLVKESAGEQPDFENIWANVTADFKNWIQKPNHSSISFLDLKIYLVGKIADTFNHDSIRTNKAIIDFVVAGTQVGGNEFKTRNWRGVWVSHPIIDRYITERWRIMLVLKNKNGKTFKYEYVD
jgi:hypothetical protein